jgi:hypothetical protein
MNTIGDTLSIFAMQYITHNIEEIQNGSSKKRSEETFLQIMTADDREAMAGKSPYR